MLTQFTRAHLNKEREEVTTDREETMFVPKADVREAYNMWVRVIMECEDKETDEYPDHLNMRAYSSSQFTKELKQRLQIEIDESRIRVGESSKLKWVWFGIELEDPNRWVSEIAERLQTRVEILHNIKIAIILGENNTR